MAAKTAKRSAKRSTKTAKKSATKKSTRKGARKGSAFMKPVKPSAALAVIVGTKPLPRTEVTKKIWKYIKAHKLQDPKAKRNIIPDAKLGKVIGTGKIDMFKMTAKIAKQVS